MRAVDLAAAWNANGFDVDPPNAALILDDRTHVVELRRPRFANGRVSFALRRLPGASEAGHRDVDPLRAGRYARGRLFIDDAGYPPCPSGTAGDLIATSTTCLLNMQQTVGFAALPAGSAMTVWVCLTIWNAALQYNGGHYLQAVSEPAPGFGDAIEAACADGGSAVVYYTGYPWVTRLPLVFQYADWGAPMRIQVRVD